MERHALTAMSPSARQFAWAVGRRLTGNPDHGFAIGERVPADGVGSLWDVYKCAPDLATVHRSYPQLAPLLLDPMACSIEQREHSVLIRFAQDIVSDRAEEDCRALLQVKTWAALHGVAVAPLSVHFTYARPRSTAVHLRLLGTHALHFGQAALALELERRWWDEPLPTADSAGFSGALAAALAQVREMEEDVEDLLTDRLSRDARASHLADLLGISARTLRRRLADRGDSFRCLLERVRAREDALFREASVLFGFPSLSSAERARLLGFASAGALRNALRRAVVRS